MTYFAVAAVLIIVLDVLTKWIVNHFMMLHQSIPVLGDFGRLTYIRNPGAAFGLFSGSRISFILISLVAIGIILSLLSRPHYRGRLSLTALGMILGGATGNLIDRIRVGEVVDFIDLGFGGTRWPVFNVADIGVTVGVCILAVSLYRHGEGAKAPGSDTTAQAEPPAGGGTAAQAEPQAGETRSSAGDADKLAHSAEGDDGGTLHQADPTGR